jgi:hypothetical protein
VPAISPLGAHHATGTQETVPATVPATPGAVRRGPRRWKLTALVGAVAAAGAIAVVAAGDSTAQRGEPASSAPPVAGRVETAPVEAAPAAPVEAAPAAPAVPAAAPAAPAIPAVAPAASSIDAGVAALAPPAADPRPKASTRPARATPPKLPPKRPPPAPKPVRGPDDPIIED